ncbi:hypothetical protein Hamer_G004900 [Homarus americanus]|uniref:Uncharacterized protein n=1 Tax=Homarus americanus TaxID=6706 RepID=A0A8J5JYZ6_HOMAM|nr:hypothetical protein Hamer_G004900 [Homarus americanus]
MSRRVTARDDIAAVIALYKANHELRGISAQTGVGLRVVQKLVKRYHELGEDVLPAPLPKSVSLVGSRVTRGGGGLSKGSYRDMQMMRGAAKVGSGTYNAQSVESTCFRSAQTPPDDVFWDRPTSHGLLVCLVTSPRCYPGKADSSGQGYGIFITILGTRVTGLNHVAN